MRHKGSFNTAKNVTAHYYLVLAKLQTSFCTEILLSIEKTVFIFCHLIKKPPKGGFLKQIEKSELNLNAYCYRFDQRLRHSQSGFAVL